MTGQPWLAYSFAALMIMTAGYCVTRLAISWRRRRPTDHLADATHSLMGVAMTGMLVPQLRVFWTGGWEVVFVVAAACFGWLALGNVRGRAGPGGKASHHLHHLLVCGVMVFMLALGAAAVASTRSATMGSSPAHFHTLSLILAFGLIGYVVWTTDRLSSLAPVAVLATSGTAKPMSLRLAACCEIAMGLAMGYMLIAG